MFAIRVRVRSRAHTLGVLSRLCDLYACSTSNVCCATGRGFHCSDGSRLTSETLCQFGTPQFGTPDQYGGTYGIKLYLRMIRGLDLQLR